MTKLQIVSNQDIQEYSRFSDYEEFTLNMEIWLIDHQKKFTRGEMVGLHQLIQLSSNIPGVCHKSMGAIVKSTYEGLNEHAISRSTFKRMIWKCSQFGMVTAYETKVGNGNQGNNLYVFQPYPAF
ncbi:hypothetical protein [Bacillus timonensis]|uniref:hypothetical protein n=1 Tax=Bacillus timonensis TaxID=1033734 RepID=UPI00028957D0|nr:hypothetical protein [Bacillus timonensis]